MFLLASSGAMVDKPVTDAGRSAVPQSSTIKVTANVKGAEVTIDGIKQGVTDLSSVTVSPGEHRVAVSKDGYETYRQTVNVRKGRQFSMQVILDPLTSPKGALYVNIKPEDATVKILNIGPTFYQGIPLDEGRYHVSVEKSGYETDDRWVDISAGEDKTLTIRLGKKESVSATAGSAFTNDLGMTFVYIAPGSFMMGSPASEPDRYEDETQHRVTLSKGYYMQTTEVTQGQWASIMGTDVRQQRDKVDRTWEMRGEGDDYPMYYVSWDEAQEFVRKLNAREGTTKYRLPTEAEWEHACRAGSDTPYANGNSLDTMGWYSENSGSQNHRVAQKKANAWGLYDMHGNVWEWCSDWKGDYPSGSVTDPRGASLGSNRVLRGGGWSDVARYCRSALRYGDSPGSRYGYLGFRLVCLQAGR